MTTVHIKAFKGPGNIKLVILNANYISTKMYALLDEYKLTETSYNDYMKSNMILPITYDAKFDKILNPGGVFNNFYYKFKQLIYGKT